MGCFTNTHTQTHSDCFLNGPVPLIFRRKTQVFRRGSLSRFFLELFGLFLLLPNSDAPTHTQTHSDCFFNGPVPLIFRRKIQVFRRGSLSRFFFGAFWVVFISRHRCLTLRNCICLPLAASRRCIYPFNMVKAHQHG